MIFQNTKAMHIEITFQEFCNRVKDRPDILQQYCHATKSYIGDFFSIIESDIFDVLIARKSTKKKLTRFIKKKSLENFADYCQQIKKATESFLFKCTQAKDIQNKTVQHYWYRIIFESKGAQFRGQLGQKIQIMKAYFQVQQEDICQLLANQQQKCILANKLFKIESSKSRECLEHFNLLLSQISYKKYLEKLLQDLVMPGLFYFFQVGPNHILFKQSFSLALKNKVKLLFGFKKMVERQKDFIRLIDKLLEKGKRFSTCLKNVLMIIVLLQNLTPWIKNTDLPRKSYVIEIVNICFARLLYYSYDYRMRIVPVILIWLNATQNFIFEQKIFNDSIFAHIITVSQLLWNYPNFEENMNNIKNLLVRLEQNNIKTPSKYSKLKLKLDFRPNQTSVTSTLLQDKKITRKSEYYNITAKYLSDIKILAERLNFQKMYLRMKEFRIFIDQSSDLPQNAKQHSLQKIIYYIRIINQFKLVAPILVQQITFEIFQLVSIIFPDGIPHYDRDNFFQYKFLGFQAKQPDWLNVIEKLKRKSRFGQYKLITVYRLRLIQELVTQFLASQLKKNQLQILISQKNPKKTKMAKQKYESLQEDLLQFAMDINIVKQNKRVEVIIRNLLLLDESDILCTLFLNLLIWYFIHSKKSRRKSQQEHKIIIKQDKKVQNLIENFIKKYIIDQKCKNSEFSYVLLHAHHYLEIWQREQLQRKTTTPHIYKNYFHILKKQQSWYSHLSQAYLILGSIKAAAYFKELKYYQSKQVNKKQLQRDLVNLYERLQPKFSRLRHIIQNKLNLQKWHQQNQIIQQNKQNQTQYLENLIKILQISYTRRNEGEILSLIPNSQLVKMRIISLIEQISAKIPHLKITEQIHHECLKIHLLKSFCDIVFKTSFIKEKVEKSQLIVSIIKKLNSHQQRVLCYQILNKIHNSQQNRKQYYSQLFKEGKKEKLIKLLRPDIPYEERSYSELHALLLINLKQEQYQQVLLIIHSMKQLQKKQKGTISIESEIYFYELQTKSQFLLNFNLTNVCSLMMNCLLQMKNANKQSTQFILKMFRMVYDQYVIITIGQVEKMVNCFEIYMQTISKSENSKNYKIEGLFYFLRFIFQKFTIALDRIGEHKSKYYQIWAERIIKNNDVSVLKPHYDYLIRRISNNLNINSFIEKLLFRIAQQYPFWSAWWLSGLIYHKFKASQEIKQELFFDDTDNQIKNIGFSIKKQLEQKRIQINKHLEFIKKILCLNTKSIQDLNQVPNNLSSPFDQNKIIKKIIKVDKIPSGKSQPTKITVEYTLTVENQDNLDMRYNQSYIMKFNPIKVQKKQNFRIQSNVANFFKSIGIIDDDTTYSVVHLSKFALLIQQVKNIGTFRKIINLYSNPQHMKIIENQIYKQKANVLNKIYDEIKDKIKSDLHLMFFNVSSISEWYTKFNNFTKTTAQWSVLGYIIGLGDRHCENILITESGKVSHIDFQYSLDCGMFLPCPQWVPFRLTRCLKQPLGILGPYGLFLLYFIQTIELLHHKQREIWKSLSYFYDGQHTVVIISKIMKRILGNQKKSIQQRALQLLQIAQNDNLLRNMFVGWKSYL